MDVYNVEQLAKKFHCHHSSIYKLINEGELLAFKVGRAWCVTQDALDTFILNQQESAKNRCVAERSYKACQSAYEEVFTSSISLHQVGSELDKALAQVTAGRR